ncbi:eCIS core domain-containing protein [Portibacter lacus]|uniref:eCIS core domain-containing protein n=1 Tax=Portibacter lacus TaxID=1099794 RepID=A0AA37SM47_9BACT|nr:DUF4157 domain-containing protein [Portibacter lacus]GLR17011.1 hypothetical protein GCM10007940_16260 [Portibacter lacus]
MDKIHDFVAQPKAFGKANANENISAENADDRVSMSPPTFQLRATPENPETEEKEEKVSPEPAYQLAAEGSEPPADASSSPPNEDSSPSKPNNTGLPNQLKSGIENLSGFSLDDVNVHYNSSKPAQLQAHAYTQGTDIHVAAGQEKHLPHEAWHVVQQKQGRVQATTQMKGIGVNDDAGLEKEADVMGAKAMEMKNISSNPLKNKNSFSSDSFQPIQRRIGFEIETGIPVSLQDPNPPNNYMNIGNNWLEAPFPGGKLMVDHLPGHANIPNEPYNDWSIIEFVTDPIADNLSNNNFRNVATGWVTDLQNLSVYAQANHGPIQNAPNVGPPGSGLNINIGQIPGGVPIPANYWDRVGPQSTMGVKLKNIGNIFQNETVATGYLGHVRHDRVSHGTHQAQPTANLIMTDIHAAYPKRVHTIRQGYQDLKGLIVLICNYILAGSVNQGRGGYRKNHTSVMYKSKLSSVRNNIINKSYPAFILDDSNAKRTAVRNIILNRCNRTAADEVFQGITYNNNNILSGHWIDSILNGATDWVFEAMKNPWSAEIAPEDVKGSSGFVMEMRDSGDFNMSNLGLNGLNDTNTLVDYLARIYMKNKEWRNR